MIFWNTLAAGWVGTLYLYKVPNYKVPNHRVPNQKVSNHKVHKVTKFLMLQNLSFKIFFYHALSFSCLYIFERKCLVKASVVWIFDQPGGRPWWDVEIVFFCFWSYKKCAVYKYFKRTQLCILLRGGQLIVFLSPITNNTKDWGLDPISDSPIVFWVRQDDIWYSDSLIAEKITVR